MVKQLAWSLDYLNVSVGFVQNHFNKLRILQRVKEVGVKAVKVWLDADTLHHEVLRHPGHKLLLHGLLQLFNLDTHTPICLTSHYSRVRNIRLKSVIILPFESCLIGTGC